MMNKAVEKKTRNETTTKINMVHNLKFATIYSQSKLPLHTEKKQYSHKDAQIYIYVSFPIFSLGCFHDGHFTEAFDSSVSLYMLQKVVPKYWRR